MSNDSEVIDRDAPIIANPEDDPVNDMYPGLIMGIQAILGTFWWILSWFMYL